MARSREDGRDMLFDASKELFGVNLNINASKVMEFPSRDRFFGYWAFDIFDLLEDRSNKEKINRAIELYFERTASNESFREESVLKRILQCVDADFEPIDAHLRFKLLAKFLEPDFLVQQDYWVLNKLASILKDKAQLFNVLDQQVKKVRFNSFHYNLLKFYKKWRPDFPQTEIQQQIEEINLRMG